MLAVIFVTFEYLEKVKLKLNKLRPLIGSRTWMVNYGEQTARKKNHWAEGEKDMEGGRKAKVTLSVAIRLRQEIS